MPKVGGSTRSYKSGHMGILTDVILSAVRIVKGTTKADKAEVESCKEFLLSEKCQKWASWLNIDYSYIANCCDDN